jgi:aspartate carbamoyltransferase catalytic subunit
MRHPKEGAPYVAKDKSLVPIVNAGDGGHYHPTQTLADLLTIYRKKGRVDNLTIGLVGDLKYGRTVHSLIEAMSRYEGISFVLISPDELKLPDFVKDEFITAKGIKCEESTSLEDSISKVDVLYMTRIQQERFLDRAEYERLKDVYVLDTDKMALAKPDCIVLHPLPRVNEISVKVDSDPRACYFEQTRCGKFIRMALILKLLAEKDLADTTEQKATFAVEQPCKNPHCISTTEQELERLAYTDGKGVKRCAYCDAEI